MMKLLSKVLVFLVLSFASAFAQGITDDVVVLQNFPSKYVGALRITPQGQSQTTLAQALANVVSTVAATGSSVGSPVSLTTAMTFVSSVPAGGCIIVPAGFNAVTIYNIDPSNSLLVLPPSGAQINVLGTNATAVLAAGASVNAYVADTVATLLKGSPGAPYQ